MLYTAGTLVAAAIVFFALNSIYGFTAGASSGAGSRLTATVRRGTVLSSVSASGNVAVAQSASANFATSGTITAVDVVPGEHVRAGQAIATIDPTSARNTLASARANLATARSALASAESGLTAAQRDANTISLQQARQTVTTDAQQLAADRSALASAQTQLARDAKLGFPATASGSGAAAAGSGSASSGSGAAAAGSGSASSGASTGSGSAPSGAASSGSGSGSSASGSGSSGTASSGSGTGSSGSGPGGSGTGAPTHSVLAPAGSTTATTASAAAAPSAGATTPAAGPGVATGAASAIGTSSATLTGNVTPGGLDTTYDFVYGTSPTSLTNATPTTDAGSGTGSVPVSVTVSGLAAGQSYYFELIATNSSGTTDGSLALFGTAAATPIVTTGQATGVATTSVTLSGSVQPQGLRTSYHFAYGTSATSLDSGTQAVDAGAGAGSVPATATVTGLSPGRTYYFELVATNSAGTSDGALGLFTTGQASAVATTGQASAIGSTTVTLTGSVNPGGLSTTDHFEYGTSASALSSRTAAFDDGSGSGSVAVSVTLDGLKPNTTYAFRVVATNASGTSDGVDESFTTTAAAPPTVVTGSGSGALTSSVTLAGSVDPAGSDTKYWFEYGTTLAYGSRTAVEDAGSGTSASSVSATLTGLQQDTEYIFRLVAQNAFGTSTGLGEVVTTASSSQAADEQAVTTDEQTVQHAAATLATAKASLAETRATIAASETPATATVEADRATVAQDQATVAADEQSLGETTLRAPLGGTVTAVNATVGQTVSAGTTTISDAGSTSSSSSSSSSGASALGGSGASGSGASGSGSGSSLFTIESLGTLEIVAGFAEADATRIAVGQPVTITFPALPNTEVAGRVVAVSQTSTVVSNVVTYDETIRLINPPATVKEGMTADVSVVDQTATNVLYVASAAITTTGTVSTVELLAHGHTTQRRVVTGLVGNSDTQIVSGLAAGDVVVEPTVSVVGSTGTAGTSTGFGGGGGGGFFGGGGGLGRALAGG